METLQKTKKDETNSSSNISAGGWFVLSMPWMMTFLLAILNFSLGIMLPMIQKEVGFTTVQAGYLSSLGSIITVTLLFPMTALINRKGPKILLAIAFLIAAVSLVMQSSTNSYAVLLVFRTINVGLGVVSIPVLGLLKQILVPVEKIEVVNGIETIMIPVGQTIATFFMPIFLLHIGNWRLAYKIVAALIFIVGLMWIFYGKNKVDEDQAEKNESAFLSAIGTVLKKPSILLIAVSMIGTTATWTSFFTFWPNFALDHIHLDLNTAGLLLSLMPIGSIISSLSIPRISKATGVEKPFIWIWGFLLPISYFLMLSTDRIFVLSLGSFMAGFGASAYVPLISSYPYKLRGFSRAAVTVGVGVISIAATLGAALGPIVTSYISEGTGDLGTALKISCLFPITLAICGLFLPSKAADNYK